MDDGHDRETVAAYVRFATASGPALTSNYDGSYAVEWAPHADALAPLIAAGQVQIGNYTFSPRPAPAPPGADHRRAGGQRGLDPEDTHLYDEPSSSSAARS